MGAQYFVLDLRDNLGGLVQVNLLVNFFLCLLLLQFTTEFYSLFLELFNNCVKSSKYFLYPNRHSRGVGQDMMLIVSWKLSYSGVMFIIWASSNAE